MPLLFSVNQQMDRLSKVDDLYWELLFYGIVFVYTAVLVGIAFDYRPDARLFPVVVGTLLLGLVLLKVAVLGLSRWRDYSVGQTFGGIGGDFQNSDEADPSQERLDPPERYKRQIQMIGWLVLLIGSIWAVGFQITMVPFVFSFVYFYERNLGKAVVAAVVTLFMVYVIFIQILSASLWPGVFL